MKDPRTGKEIVSPADTLPEPAWQASQFMNRKETDAIIDGGAKTKAAESRVALESLGLAAEVMKILEKHIKDAWETGFRRGVGEYAAWAAGNPTAKAAPMMRQGVSMIPPAMQGVPLKTLQPSAAEIRIKCLELAKGDVTKAAAMEAFVTGTDRPPEQP